MTQPADPQLTPPTELPDSDATRRQMFVQLIREGCDLTEAAAGIGVSRWSIYRWRKTDAAFDQAISQAEIDRVECLVKEAERRALRGSDKLLMFLLCNYHPERFSNTQKVEHSGQIELAQAIVAARSRAGS